MVKEFVKFTWPVACMGRDHKGTYAESKRDVSLFGKGKRPCMQGREPCVLKTCRT